LLRGRLIRVTAANRRTVARVDPHLVLAAAAALVVAAEAAYSHAASDAWLALEVGFSALGLLYAWREQERLRLAPLLAIAFAFQLAYVAVHLGFDVRSDFDSRVLFKRYGNELLDGNYPESEYPVGAVLLFAFEAWISGGSTRVANAFAMIPFQVLLVGAVWALRTRTAPWLAAVVALLPLNPYFVEFKFDVVAAAALVLGLVLAQRGRWAWSGVVLGLGAVVKWTPGLAFVVLLAWLVASRASRAAVRHAVGFAVTVAVVYVPFLVWRPDEVLHAYTEQGGRDITPESLWYLPLRALGIADFGTHVSKPADAPEWTNVLATVVQLLLVLGVILLAMRRRGNAPAALALAALAPAVFLLTNRIFSPQFVLVLVAAWAVAAALVALDRREQLLAGLAAGLISVANAFVYPYALPHYDQTWVIASGVLFSVGLLLTGWLTLRAAGTARASG
jgi:Glycosyltransferase family 87